MTSKTDILISFNNTYQSPGFPSLGVLDPQTLELQIVDLPETIPQSGMLGLAISSNYIFTGLQYAYDASRAYRIPPEVGLQYGGDGTLASLHPCSLLIFDRLHFTLLDQYFFKQVSDVHSFLLSPDEKILYVVSTGTDEIIQLELDGFKVKSEKVIWRPEPDGERADHHHLNSICLWKGDIIISGFGKKEVADDWNSAQNGFIRNISKNKMLIEGLKQPHSLAVINEKLAFCESGKKTFRWLNDDLSVDLGAYSRGLCSIGDQLFVGTSARRNKSKSTGKVIKNKEADNVGCTVSKISVQNLELLQVKNLNEYGYEIYDLMAVDNTLSWPLIEPVNYHIRFLEAWDKQKDLAWSEIKNFAPEGSTIIMIDENALGFDEHYLGRRKVLPFNEKDGHYWGAPENDEVAISEITRIEKVHPGFSIVFAWPAFWWLDTFKKMAEYLRTNYQCAFHNDRLMIYKK